MSNEEYIFKKLENLSPVDRILCEKIVKALGEWCSIRKVAKYLDSHPNTIYEKVSEGEIFARRIKGKILIYSQSLVLIME